MANFNFENTRFLDVVNEKDEVIDSKPRSDVHRFGLLHREIHVWMFDENKNIFFQKRGLHRPSAGLLDATVGGHVDGGEDYLAAAVRETKEEAGITILASDLVLLKKFKKNSTPIEDDLPGKINNFFRNIYIYKYPIKEEEMKKEVGLLGVGFKKLSPDILLHPSKEDTNKFDRFILTDELPEVLQYVRTYNEK